MQRSRKMTFMAHFYATVYSGHTKQNCSLNLQQGSEKEKHFNSIDTEASLGACPSVIRLDSDFRTLMVAWI